MELTSTPASQNSITLLSLNLSGSGVNWTNNAGQTLTVPGIIKSGGGSLSTISGGTALTGGTGIELVIRTDTSSDLLTLSTPVTGTGALTKSGAGTLTLAGANTYTGQTYVNGGTLSLTSSLVTNAAININGTGIINQSAAGVIGGTGVFVQNSSGTSTLSLANTFTGTTTVSAGTLALTNGLALQNSALVTTGAGTVTLGTGVTTPTFGGLSGASGNLATIISSGYGSVTNLTLNPNSGTVTYAGVIANGASGMTLTKTGAGTQVLNGNNTYTGATIINGGTLSLGGSATLLNSSGLTLGSGVGLTLTNTTTSEGAINRVSDSTGITSNGFTLTYTNTSGAGLVYAETLGAVALTTGQFNAVEATNMAGGSGNMQTLTLSDLTRTGSSNASAVTFSAAGTGPQISSNQNMIVVTGAGTTASNQIIGPWASVGTTAALQTDYAVYNANYVVGLGATPVTSDTGWTTSWANTSNYAWGNGTTGMTLASTKNINTLRHTGGAETLTVATGANLGTYGILNGVANLLTIAATGTGAVTLPTTTAGSLYVTTGSAGITISAPITDNTGALTLVKSGTGGNLILSGTNTYSGGTVINAGTLYVGNNTAGTLGSGSYAGNIFIAGGATLAVWSTVAQTLSGVISGAGNLTKGYGGALTLSGANTYTGQTTIVPQTTTGCQVNVSSFNSVNGGTPLLASSSLGAPTTVANGTIQIGSGSAQAGVTLNYTGPGETTDRVISIAFNGTDSQTISASGTGLLKFTSAFTVSPATTGSLILRGTGNGEIVQGIPQLSSGGLSKQDAGTWTLDGASTYTGATTVSGGMLNVTGSLTSAVTVANSATLSGTGSTTSTLALSNGSTIVGTTTGSSFSASTVTATSSVNIAGSDGSGTIGSHTIGVVRYGTGTGPTVANFSTTGYHSGASVANVGGAGGETQLTYTNAARTWNSASTTWDAMTTSAWQEGDFKYGQGDAVTFDDSGTGGGSARTVTLSSLVTPGSVTFNNATSTYTVSGSGAVSGLSGVTKSGTGKVTLATANTYTGATTVNGGSLSITGSTSAGSAVTVSNAGTKLMGTGTVGGATAINSGAILAPGNGGVGKQTFGSTVTLNSGSIFEWELGSTPIDTAGGGVRGTTYDAVNVAGTLSGSGAIFRVVLNGSQDFSDTFWNANHTWTDIFKTADAGSNVSFASLFGSVQYYNTTGGALTGIPGTQGTFTVSGNTLTWTAVPEPTSALAGILLGAGLLRRRRK